MVKHGNQEEENRNKPAPFRETRTKGSHPDENGQTGDTRAVDMRIAIVMSGKKVSPHFGKAEEMMLVEVKNGNIRDRDIVTTSPRECGTVLNLLLRENVKRLVTGKIGARALEKLETAGIRVYSGAEGSVEDALGSLLSGALVSRGDICEKNNISCSCD